MPTPMLKSLAKRYRVSLKRAESAWRACKKGVKPKQGKDGYGIVVNCVKAKLRRKKK